MPDFDNLEEYKALREKWVHEDHVVNHRLTWLILSQAMLMAAYGWSLSNPQPKTAKLLILMPTIGIVFTLAIGLSVGAAVIAQNHLAQVLDSKSWPQPFTIDTYTPVNWPGRVAALALPFFLFVVWLVVLVA